ncbi:hypothetical protein A4U49_05280 [Acidithiobacillus ferrivorans]|uniref:hypothetical protein n=1 Tax=Acidithiobacillus ferrivorans TaxID=160808 RepID=UPI000893BEC7|nr:hypothetical protein [Acidithiobacillus ferrivorans]OFA16844.1 hypothetical protein A4U49_05280 [Acidithiobacillus ferrivorans]
MREKSIMDQLADALGSEVPDADRGQKSPQQLAPSPPIGSQHPQPPARIVTDTESPLPASKVGRPRAGDQPMTPAERAKKSAERRVAEDAAVWQSEDWGFADNRTLARLLTLAVSRTADEEARHKARQIVGELHRRLNGA